MQQALRPGTAQGFARRASLGRPVQLLNAPSRDQLEQVIQATYRQLLNRELVAAERLADPESQLRDGQLSVAEFVGQVASSELFLRRLARLAPLRAAAAAYLALLGRAAQPRETSEFLATRVRRGLAAAVEALLNSGEYAASFGQNTVPYLKGLNSADGIPLQTVNRTAALYAGNAGLTPAPRGAV
jgi:phycobilisome core-membrane linker protein